VLGPVFHVLKVTRLSYDIGAYVFYFGFPALVLLLMAGIFSPYVERPTPPLAALLVIMMAAASVMTIVHGGDIIDIAGNLLRLLFCLFTILFFTTSSFAYVATVNRILGSIARLALVFSLGAASFMHLAAASGLGVYFGLQNTASFISLAYGLAFKRWAYALLSVVAIIASGKRGAMMSMVVMALVYLVVLFRQGQMQKLVFFVFFSIGAALLVVTGGFLPESILARFSQFTSGDAVDWNMATAGRVDELEAALFYLGRHEYGWLTGYGLGAAIDINGQTDSTIHFSPFGMVIIFGAPLTLLFYCALMWQAGQALRKKVINNPYALSVYLIFVAEFIFSFSAFTVMQSYMLWLCLAYLISVKIVQDSKRLS